MSLLGRGFKMGHAVNSWRVNESTEITLIITQNCQLRRKYCYEPHKNAAEAMTFNTVKDIIDYLFANREVLKIKDAIGISFIGGEPLLEIELIDQVCDYFQLKAYNEYRPWLNKHAFKITTNGILYTDPKVRRFIKKNQRKVSMGISIDGTKTKHDLQRIYPDGRGSYCDIVALIPLWIKQFPGAGTKVIISSDDFPYGWHRLYHG